jgi:hypothetical protein
MTRRVIDVNVPSGGRSASMTPEFFLLGASEFEPAKR